MSNKPKKIKPEQKQQAKFAVPDMSNPEQVKKHMDQLSDSQIEILKMMNEFNSRLASVEVENQKLFNVLAMLTKKHDEFRNVLEMLGRGLKQLKTQIEDDGSDASPEEAPGPAEKRDPPLHDDITVTCQVCDRVYNGRLDKCPRCGFTGNKNKKKGR